MLMQNMDNLNCFKRIAFFLCVIISYESQRIFFSLLLLRFYSFIHWLVSNGGTIIFKAISSVIKMKTKNRWAIHKVNRFMIECRMLNRWVCVSNVLCNMSWAKKWRKTTTLHWECNGLARNLVTHTLPSERSAFSFFFTK